MNMISQKNKLDDLMKDFEEFLSSKDDRERIETKASFIQLDILDEVKLLMKEKNISRTQLAKKLSKSKSFVSQLFSGDKALNLKMIAQFQEIFNAKFIPSFKDYSEIIKSNNFTKDKFMNDKDYVKDNPVILNISDYSEIENKVA